MKYKLEGLYQEGDSQQTITVSGERQAELSMDETVRVHAAFLGLTHYVWWTEGSVAGYDVDVSQMGVGHG